MFEYYNSIIKYIILPTDFLQKHLCRGCGEAGTKLGPKHCYNVYLRDYLLVIRIITARITQ